ncbi:MAG: flippase [Candidatus Omnitrophica bacterium]|nr:flippase [Candidatus Omnitrophota bacterium]
MQNIENSKNILRILRNTFFLYSSFSVNQIIIFFTTFYLARIFSPLNYGKLSFSFTVANYFSLFNLAGFSILGMRWIATAKDNQQIKFHINQIVSIRTILSFLAFLTLCIFLPFIKKDEELLSLIFLYGLVILVSNLSLGWIFHGIQKMEFSEIPSIISSVIYINLIFLLVKSEHHLLRVPLIALWQYIFLFTITVFFMQRLLGKVYIDFNISFLKENLNSALTFSVFPILVYLVNNIEKLLLGFMSNNLEVGYYFASYRIFYLLYSLVIPLYGAIFPALSRYYTYAPDSFKKLCYSAIDLMFILSIPIAIIFFLFATQIIMFIYRYRYISAVPILQILTLNLILIYINSFFSQALLATGKEDKVIFNLIIQGISILISCIFFIPKMGTKGASYSQIFGQLIAFFIYYREFNRILEVNLLRFMWRPFVASLAIIIPFKLLYLDRNLIISFLGAGSFYILVLTILGGLPWNEMRLIWNIIKSNQNK